MECLDTVRLEGLVPGTRVHGCVLSLAIYKVS